MVHNKTISLDERTALIASRMPNFSRWVRRQLLEHARSADNDNSHELIENHVAPKSARVWGPQNNRCNPKHRDGLCETCYGGDE